MENMEPMEIQPKAPSFSQEELDRIVADRLARANKAFEKRWRKNWKRNAETTKPN